MKILYLSKALVVGAYQTKMEALAALPGVELVAATPSGWKDERGMTCLERAHTAGYELREIPIVLNGSFHAHFYPALGRLLNEVRPDLFHIDEEAYNFATFHAAWQAGRRKIPFLFFTWQNLMRHYPPPFSWMEQWLFRHSAHAIAGNRDALEVLSRKGYAGRATVIPQFGVDPGLFRMKNSRTAGPAAGSHPIMLGYAGRLVPEKGLDVLLDALAGLDRPDWRLELRGSGPAQGELEQQAQRLGIADRVAFLPSMPSTEMPSFYASLDLFVLPSLTRPNWKEQFGRVLIEAMASGVVVVGSDSGEIPHVIGEAGVVVPEGNAEALRRALCELFDDPPRRNRLAQAGRQRVLDHFTQDEIARRTLEVYREVAERTPGG